jgi:CDP-4-dehydro-6-deoxyglucose reductase, E1
VNVPASGAVITDADKQAMHAAVDAGWLTAGPITEAFERGLSEYTGIRNVLLCNSGSSANLLAVAAMVESGRWKRGDIIVTVAASFPTTINPLLLYGLVPMFVDIDLGTYNANVDQVWRACNGQNVKGIMLAHTLGNPFDAARFAEIARKRGIWLVEDCCDALGSTLNGTHVGNYGSIATCSFFPAHHITTGEGGAVFTNDAELAGHVASVRDWGRDCWCLPGKENTCGKRFEWSFAGLPYGYDHKYLYSRLGFNLKSTEIAAACGLSQLERLPEFVAARRANFGKLHRNLENQSNWRLVEEIEGAVASWFGFPLTLEEPGIRAKFQSYLAQEGVGSRLVFAGNIVKQPYFKGRQHLVAAALTNTDRVMADSLWIGCHPALSDEHLEYAATKVKHFLGDF